MRLAISAFFLFCSLFINAQGPIGDNAIVKDSSGTVYPAAVWKNLLRKGYSLHAVDPKDSNTSYLLVKLSDSQLNGRYERLPKPRESAFFKTGEKFSGFKTTDMNGNKIDLKSTDGKITVINFWFINCQPCRMEIPDLNELVDSFKTNPQVQFIAVALDDRYALKEFLKNFPFNYSIVDNGRFIADKYGVRSFPTHVIINTDGKIYFHTTGLSTNTVYWIKKTIKELLQQQETTASSN